jgi:5'-3' exonuclease
MKILIIDSYNMIHRAKYGFYRGDHSTTFGFFRCLKSEIDRHNPDKVYLVSEGYPKHRYEISDSYKGTRKKSDDSFLRQKKDIFELCKKLPITFVRHPDFECDDVIGELCRTYNKQDKTEVVICSSDSDFIQLLELNNVRLWNPVKKKFIDEWPVSYLRWKSLKGDTSDNISGVSGVGEKTAFKLAADNQLFQDYMAKNPSKRNEYEKSLAMIKLANVDFSDSKMENNDYNFSESSLREDFIDRGFKSIAEKSWSKWQNTMEALNERRKKNVDSRPAV